MNSRGIFFKSFSTPVLNVRLKRGIENSEVFLQLIEADSLFIPALCHHRQVVEILLELFVLLEG